MPGHENKTVPMWNGEGEVGSLSRGGAERVIMLGTGDPLNDERVQTSLAVPLEGDDILLVDTTSGTALLGQLRQAGLDLARIRHLFVTHRHFDHAGGLAPLLVALIAVPEADITVYTPNGTVDALHALLELTIPGVEEWIGRRLRWRALGSGTPVEAGSALVTPFAVDHAVECFGLRMELPSRTVVFSADTRPCSALVACAQGADLLIHEAYGLAPVAEEAHTFGHSTAADAGIAARDAGVERLLLTHFRASRFVEPAHLQKEAAIAFGRPVGIACDLGIVNV